ncbi:MAG TPA: chemotaxis protein CheW [bacterium]|mgnify:CR=1 FL=1|jgi:purine-binding chemotaxis protein CheW|nr:chemotaxis protein CheW [Dictyoglomota bacterium]HOK29068.1 chemotaxis protein CheW [bacterium]HOL55022.1 chemotaxis protein CheW [bacterium]HON72759.1 chemotaxis protein CheW [bacterium]HOP55531.1 chemotaxis protein CheW [bacterium]
MAEERQLVVFSLLNENYGIDIYKVQEIIQYRDITYVPKSPPFVKGVINLRGRIIPVIDLKERFGLPEKEVTPDTRIIVVEISSQTIGLIVDSVTEVLRIPNTNIEPPPPVTTIEADFIEGVGKLDERLIIILDIDRILTKEEKRELAGIE